MPTTFLDLPPEIRNTIYGLVLPQSGATIQIPRSLLQYQSFGEPTISAVCRQVRRETLSIHYGGNAFQAEKVYHTRAFIEAIGPERAAMLGELRVFQWDRKLPDRILEMLECLTEDLECRMYGVRPEAVFVPVGPGVWRRLVNLRHSILYRKVRAVMVDEKVS